MVVAGVAQSVEQLIRNQQVTGSSPVTSSIKKMYKPLRFVHFLFTDKSLQSEESE